MHEPPIGTRLGPYRLLERIGQGGMGVVFRARDERTGELVALKTLRRVEPRALAALRHEIRTLAALRHPGVVRVAEHGLDAHGLPWVAMAWLRGHSLRQHLAHARADALADDPTLGTAALDVTADDVSLFAPTPLAPVPDDSTLSAGETRVVGGGTTPVRALEPFVQLALTLGWLHGEGVVHRDIKPDNVLVEPDGRVVLVDFGIAAAAPGAAAREHLVDGALGIGTPTYMAPEQITGRHVDARCDLYALGIMLYEALAGRPPYVGEARAVARAHLEETPAPLTGVPPALAELVAGLLARDPHARPGHGLDVAARLAEVCGLPASPEALLARYALPKPRTHLYRPALCGRSELLRGLDERLDALDEGRGGVLLLEGEAGLGRTRLLVELAERIESRRRRRARPLWLLRGRCGDGTRQPGTAPLAALFEALEPVVDACRAGGPERTAALLGQQAHVLAVHHEPLRAWLATLGDSAPPMDAAALPARERALLAVDTVLERLAREGGVVVVLDDVHLADPWTAAWLARQPARAEAALPLQVVATMRSESRTGALDALCNHPDVEHHRLEHLDPASLAAMVESMLALREPTPPLWIATLGRHAGGNPWFVAEYLRVASFSGLLARDPHGHWQLSGDDPETIFGETTPGAVYDLVYAHLAELSPAADTLVSVVALHGGTIAAELLEQLVDDEVYAGLDDALQRAVLELDASGRLRLRHDKLHDVIYTELGEERRRELHTALASTLHHLGGESGYFAERGHHWAGAGYADAAWPCLLNAGIQAHQRGELEHAASFLSSALEQHGGHDDLYGLRIRRQFAAALFELGYTTDGLTRLAEVAARAEAAGQTAEQLEATLAIASSYQLLGHGELLEQWLAAAEPLIAPDDAPHRAQILGMRVNHAVQRGDLEVVEALAAEALALQRALGWHAAEGALLSALGDVAWYHRERPDEARAHYAAALEAHRRGGHRLNEATTLSNLGKLELELGQLARAGEHLEAALALHRLCGHSRGESQVVALLGTWHARRGELERAAELVAHALAIARAVGDPQGMTRRLSQLAGIELGRDDEEAALRHALEARELADEVLHGTDAVEVARIVARCLYCSGRLDAALAAYTDTLEQARALPGARQLVASLLLERCEVERLCGLFARCRRGLEEVEAMLEAGELTVIRVGVSAHRGFLSLAEAPGDLAAARAQLEQAQRDAAHHDLERHALVVPMLRALERAVDAAAHAPHELFRGAPSEDLRGPLRAALGLGEG